jgi:hypothetical protein
MTSRVHSAIGIVALILTSMLIMTAKGGASQVAQVSSQAYLPLVANGADACAVTPTLTAPASGSQLNTLLPVLRWDIPSDPNTTRVRVEVARNPDFLQIQSAYVVPRQKEGTFEQRIRSNLRAATPYYWRVILDCRGGRSTSETWSFTTGSGGRGAAAPTLIAPTNGRTVSSPTVTFTWQPVGGASEYNLRWQLVGSTNDSSIRTASTEGQVTLDPGTYEWWVEARNDYAWGADSEHRTLTVAAP